MPEKIPYPSSAAGRLLREPLLQFFFLGAALFAAAHAVEQHRQTAQREILIDRPLAERLAKLYELQTGSLPSKARLERLVDDYVREEILFREAVRMGLDRDDEIVRRRLTQKLDFLQRDLLAIADPSEDALREFYTAHPDRFQAPAGVTFSHIYFSPDRSGSEAAKARAEKTRAALPLGVTRAPEAGDRFPLQHDYADLNPAEASQVFGKTPILNALFTAPANQWAGPFESGYGIHLIFVSSRKEAAVPPFETIRDRVKEAYLDAARRDGNEKKFEELKKGYSVNYAYLEPAR
jgi:peptidyl-prolyl cis-trans isomerase C